MFYIYRNRESRNHEEIRWVIQDKKNKIIIQEMMNKRQNKANVTKQREMDEGETSREQQKEIRDQHH